MKEKRLNVGTALHRVPILCFAMAVAVVNGQQIEQAFAMFNERIPGEIIWFC